MQKRDHVELIESLIGIACPLGDHLRIFGNPSGMSSVGCVICIDDRRKRADHLQQEVLVLPCLLFNFIIKLILQRNELDNVIHAQQEDFGYKRLSDKVHCSQ